MEKDRLRGEPRRRHRQAERQAGIIVMLKSVKIYMHCKNWHADREAHGRTGILNRTQRTLDRKKGERTGGGG
jgi:hypothetical protein